MNKIPAQYGEPGRMAFIQGRVGVVLFQLGGPESLEAIEPFLYNLFCDPDIIDFPFAKLGRKPLAKLISVARAKKVHHHYQVIGGGSPIRRFTEQQAAALEQRLQSQGVDARCLVAMRYWHPFTAEAIAALNRAGCETVVLLPLYPQYSTHNHRKQPERVAAPFHARTGGRSARSSTSISNDLYLEAVVERVNQALERFQDPDAVELVFSAHSVPVAVVEKGDPYKQQIEETVALVTGTRRLSEPASPVLPEQGRSQQMAAAFPAQHSPVAGRGGNLPKISAWCRFPLFPTMWKPWAKIDHEARELAAEAGDPPF